MSSTSALDEPPGFVRLAADAVRWSLLRELTRSDRAVRELTALVDRPPNLVSYHLRQLRDGGLVTARRSSADGRDNYYSIDLDACGRQLRSAGGALHPALAPTTAPVAVDAGRPGERARVLFLCTGNSARSQMAEALITHLSGGAVEAASAGSHPKSLHPNAVRAMAQRGIDISTNRTKHLDEFAASSFDYVITLCDRVREVCPEFPAHPALVHWSLADPAADADSDDASWPAFQRTADTLASRIEFLLAALAPLDTSHRRPSADQEVSPHVHR